MPKIEKDVIIEGSLFPEPARVIRVEDYGDNFEVDAVGLRSGQFFANYLITSEHLPGLRITNPRQSGLDFSGDPGDFHLAIEAQRIRLGHTQDPHFAVNASSITPLPHQLDAVYRYMLTAPLVRLLLADDPGAGKTIMAGLLLKELRFRGLASRVLIVVPPLVCRQWQEELHNRFAEDIQVIDSGLRDANPGRNPFLEHDRCVTSLYWAMREENLALLREAKWDLVIIDEAHKMAAYEEGKRNPKTSKTKLYHLGEELTVRTNHLLLLTATPHKGDPENFRLLLELLDKDLFADRKILDEAVKRQENPIILRRLKEEMRHFDGSPLFPPRTVKTVRFRLSAAEKQLYDEVSTYVTHHYNKAESKEKRSVGFAMTILQRRVTSSVAAISASLRRRHQRLKTLTEQVRARLGDPSALQGLADLPDLPGQRTAVPLSRLEDAVEAERWQIEESLVQELSNAESLADLEIEVAALANLMKLAAAASSSEEAKFQALHDSIIRDQGLAARGEKLLIFTEAKDTLDALESRLKAHGFSVVVLEGSMSMEQRRTAQQVFKDSAQIMIATEAGGESINLQFCNQMVNYDIPWNPNRLEQRMGRIHRIGQKNEVFIFNLVAADDTREGEVLVALLDKMEKMRKDLRSDRVFDLIGELLEHHDISLADLLIECITKRRRLEDAKASIDSAISPENQALLQKAREEGLARHYLNLPQLRVDHARSVGHALLPELLSIFTTSMLQRHKGRFATRADGGLRVERVPRELRREDDLSFRRRFGRVEARYSHLAFEKREEAELLGPGHPLFESLLRAAEEDCAAALPRGAVYYDVDLEAPERLWFFRCAVGDGTARLLTQRLLVLREGPDGAFLPSGPLRLYNLRPRAPNDPPAPVASDFTERKKAAQIHLMRQVLPRLAAEVKGERQSELEVRERYLRRSFTVLVGRHNERLAQLTQQEREGKDVALPLGNEQRALDDTRRRMEERLAEIAKEQQVVSRAPEYLGVALLLPLPHAERPRSAGRARAPEALLQQVLTHEQAQGRIVEDVRGQELGYDALSMTPDGQSLRFLLVRDADPTGRIWLKRAEFAQLLRLGDEALLYVATAGDARPLTLPNAPTWEFDPQHQRVALPL